MPTEITPEDILSPEDYAPLRRQRRQEMVEHKRHRRQELGPVAVCYFESYQTMHHQVQEMTYVERGGMEQLEDELRAFNPLVPKGSNLSCTLMFEIDERDRRNRFLARLGGVEESLALSFAGERVLGQAAPGVERSTPGGKASSVHFLLFPFTRKQIEQFIASPQVHLGFEDSRYPHMTVLSAAIKNSLASDFIL